MKSLGFKVVIVPASLGANALMSTFRSIVIDVIYQGISPEIMAADGAAETPGVSMMCMGRIFSLNYPYLIVGIKISPSY